MSSRFDVYTVRVAGGAMCAVCPRNMMCPELCRKPDLLFFDTHNCAGSEKMQPHTGNRKANVHYQEI